MEESWFIVRRSRSVKGKIRGFNDNVLKRKTSVCDISEFLNSPSPAPKKKWGDEGMTVIHHTADDSDNHDDDDVAENVQEVSYN